MKYKECEQCGCNIYDTDNEEFITLRMEKEVLIFCDEQCGEQWMLEYFDMMKDRISFECY